MYSHSYTPSTSVQFFPFSFFFSSFNKCVTLDLPIILYLKQDATTPKKTHSYNNREKNFRISNISETQYFSRAIENTRKNGRKRERDRERMKNKNKIYNVKTAVTAAQEKEEEQHAFTFSILFSSSSSSISTPQFGWCLATMNFFRMRFYFLFRVSSNG